MNVATITMPAAEAAERYREYAEGLAGREPTDEDRGVMLGYRALAKGRSLIDLHEVFRHCPANEHGQPQLAVARAHWRHVTLTRSSGGAAIFHQGQEPAFRGRPAWHRRLLLPAGTLPEACRPKGWGPNLTAVVPFIPPNLRPARAANRYYVLWEVERWEVVPADPLLLRHLHGSLYAVFAVWDLTALERAVLSGRLAGEG